MMRALHTIIALTLCAGSAQAAPITTEASGNVYNPGEHLLPPGSRLSRLALIAAPSADAYLLGAALLREAQRIEQVRLKAGLLFDLEQLAKHTESQPANAASVQRIAQWISQLPVTGRVAHLLDPRPLEATRREDLPAQPGDQLFYPGRPLTITITGAVTRHCSLAHIPMQAPAAYLPGCAMAAGASADYIYVIQPDGHTQRLGIALWNREQAPSLAPGAIIFIPLADTVVRRTAPHFNQEVARFLATQLLAAPGTNQ